MTGVIAARAILVVLGIAATFLQERVVRIRGDLTCCWLDSQQTDCKRSAHVCKTRSDGSFHQLSREKISTSTIPA